MEKYSYEYFMNEFEKRLPEEMDVSEGTLANIVMSMTAMCAANMHEEIKILEDNSYGDTAVGEALDLTVAILGLTRREATKAIVKIDGANGLQVGDVVYYGDLSYKITQINDGYYLAECEKTGIIGNSHIGEVIAPEERLIDNLNISEIVAPGQEIEDDESLRKRYLERINRPVCTGNVSYYKDVIGEIAGVGGIKVEGCSETGGVVKVTIVDAEYNPASEELVNYVKEYLDPAEYSGMGHGALPIGHRVEVQSAESVDISIEVEVNGKSDIGTYGMYLRNYFAYELSLLNQTWDVNECIIIKDRMVEDYLSQFNSVWDVNVVSINGMPNRLRLGENQIVGKVIINGL